MAVLITGGLGFIGANLARELVKQSKEVVLFDIVTESRLVDDIKDKVKIIRGDVTNWAYVLDVVREYNINCIFHAAALLSYTAEEIPLNAYMINTNGTFNVLEAARMFGVKTLVFLSTTGTYGPGLPERVSDDTEQKPAIIYGVTKVFGERLGEYYHKKFGVNFRGVRFPSIIGPGRGGGGVSAYSSLVIQEPAAGRAYEIHVDDKARIPLLYIKDAIQSLIEIEQTPEENLKRRVYNIEGFSPTIMELIGVVKKHVPDADIKFCPIPEMVEIVRTLPRVLDGSCARTDWGWKTRYTLDMAVSDFIEEYRRRKDLYELH